MTASLLHLEVPGLADDRDHRRCGREQRMPGSSAALMPRRRVMPKAAIFACLSFSASTSKNARSFGLDAGSPPRRSRRRARRASARPDLVLEREVEPLALRAVAEGGVVDLDAARREFPFGGGQADGSGGTRVARAATEFAVRLRSRGPARRPGPGSATRGSARCARAGRPRTPFWTARVISPGSPLPIAWSSTSRTGTS